MWNGEQRRATDHGREDLSSILTRIDERLKGHLSNYVEHRTDYHDHKESNDRDFKFVNRVIWTGLGGLAMLEIVFKLLGK